MPRKARRVAARQAELSQRKRRASRPTQMPEARTPVTRVEPAPAVEGSTTPVVPEPPAAIAPRLAPIPRPTPTANSRASAAYVWSDIKRIGLLSGLILIILTALTVVLR